MPRGDGEGRKKKLRVGRVVAKRFVKKAIEESVKKLTKKAVKKPTKPPVRKKSKLLQKKISTIKMQPPLLGHGKLTKNKFLRIVLWLEDKSEYIPSNGNQESESDEDESEDEEESEDESENEGRFHLDCKKFTPSKLKPQKEDIQAANAWLTAHGVASTSLAMCNALHDRMKLGKGIKVLDVLGIGKLTVVLEISHKDHAESLALAVTKRKRTKLELNISKKLGEIEVGPKIYKNFSINQLHFQLLQKIQQTFDEFVETNLVKANNVKSLARDLGSQIRKLLSKLADNNITHGDLHLMNLGFLHNHKLVLIDFDQSWNKCIEGFDLASLIDALQPHREEIRGRCFNKSFRVALIKYLLPYVPETWLLKPEVLNLKKIDAFSSAWVNFVRGNVKFKALTAILAS